MVIPQLINPLTIAMAILPAPMKPILHSLMSMPWSSAIVFSFLLGCGLMIWCRWTSSNSNNIYTQFRLLLLSRERKTNLIKISSIKQEWKVNKLTKKMQWLFCGFCTLASCLEIQILLEQASCMDGWMNGWWLSAYLKIDRQNDLSLSLSLFSKK